MDTISAFNPLTGQHTGADFTVTDDATVDYVVAAAARASRALAGHTRAWRAELLDAMAGALDSRRDEIISTASIETGFTTTKLGGEMDRTVFQLRFFGEVIREGSYLEAAIDPAGTTPMGPRPDLRRMLVPVGPVAVFGASNFPLAFSVPGGDTASALAAGSAVVVKAHSSHPGTSQLCFDALADAARSYGAPDGTIGIVFGTQAGVRLVTADAIKAVGFTGSLSGGQALLDAIARRGEPIPFYGELSSINPVIVTPAAAAERGSEIGAGLVASMTLGAGQLCTKPGLTLVPDSAGGDALVAAARAAVAESASAVLLNARTHEAYMANTSAIAELPQTEVWTSTGRVSDEGFCVAPQIIQTSLENFSSELAEETFGPVSVIVRYQCSQVEEAVESLLGRLPASLTTTVHTGSSEDTSRITGRMVEYAGRIVYNGFPTGVAVSWAQTHGGPWPSTNSLHSSVGATAIRRFCRPVTFQNAPLTSLPLELTDDYAEIPRRVDGLLRLP